MKKVIYFVTRSYLPNTSGGSLIRVKEVELLRSFFDVIVVTPNYETNELIEYNGIIKIPFNLSYTRFFSIMERAGILEDYMDFWVSKAIVYLSNKVTSNDLILSTSGGELGCIKIGSILKQKKSCKHIINFHDPIDYSLVNGLKIDNKFHVSREKCEYKYISNADLIITSSSKNKESLISKYPSLKERVKNNYFGYIDKYLVNNAKKDGKITIAYSGIFSPLQKPEILIEACEGIDNIDLKFIGNFESRKEMHKYINKQNVEFIHMMPHREFLKYMTENVDIAFVSLTSDYLGACVPSKIYEYINLELPILGALPDGDARDIINLNVYGIAKAYDDLPGIHEAALQLIDKSNYIKVKTKIQIDKDKWAMENQITEVIEWIKNLK